MSKILALDVATNCGYAVMDTDRPPSAIISGSLHFDGSTAFEKVADMRRKLPKLIREHRPDFAVIEAPLAHVPTFTKKRKTMFGEEEEVSTINPGTIMQLNRLAGAAQICVTGQNVPCVEVRPQSWMSIIDRDITGASKDRVKQMCARLKIVASNQDARDACIIAYWAAKKCVEFRLMAAGVPA
jgi:Holliday junction resolvasome RuvABC endonuclease subunit